MRQRVRIHLIGGGQGHQGSTGMSHGIAKSNYTQSQELKSLETEGTSLTWHGFKLSASEGLDAVDILYVLSHKSKVSVPSEKRPEPQKAD